MYKIYFRFDGNKDVGFDAEIYDKLGIDKEDDIIAYFEQYNDAKTFLSDLLTQAIDTLRGKEYCLESVKGYFSELLTVLGEFREGDTVELYNNFGNPFVEIVFCETKTIRVGGGVFYKDCPTKY